MTACNSCGRCCDPVVLAYSQDDVRRMPSWDTTIDPETRRFVLEDLTPIYRREGLQKADYLSAGVTVMGRPGTAGSEVFVFSMFYECRWFDKTERRCQNYANRPPICRDYPWYGAPPDESKAIPPECSYLDDVPVRFRR